ncbi:MAG: hypothetical protein SPL02_00125 [Bacilli bacterium]|nr:hypothetical protein [Bacilli bacterium]MDY6430575.1 hypothetical protein [Bacilli bacterium]
MKDKLNFTNRKKSFYKIRLSLIFGLCTLGAISSLSIPVAISYINEFNSAKAVGASGVKLEVTEEENVEEEKASEETSEEEITILSYNEI